MIRGAINEFYSFIIPVYNTEDYIGRCLDSVLNQTYTNFEVICVDDGSTDNSLSILQSYEQKDSRIKVFSQKNSGVSSARNFGLEKCVGGGDFVRRFRRLDSSKISRNIR